MRRGRMSVLVTAGCAVVAVLATLGAPARDAQPPSAAVDAVGAGVTAVPHYDHVVVVVDENHTREQVIGNPDAPWINALAASGANLTSSYGVTHPSQPNYLALFAGSTLGLKDDTCPQTYSDDNLATRLTAAGRSFVGYSESLPAAGSTVCYSGAYARKHAPWVNFPAVPASANQPFSAFPSDFTTLPSVSFVVPNLQNDMHDGTVAQGDAWLAANMDAYVTWARTHNSLFVFTFDEDDYSAANRIPTVIAGAQVRPGDYSDQVNHYNVLRTVTDAFDLPPLGQAATSAPILSAFSAPVSDTAPAASFTSACDVTACAFDASGSSDPDGTVAGWTWDFGDGTTGTGRTVTHTYTEAGVYTVGLTVTDDQGAAGSTTRQVAGAGAFAVDTFGRSVTRGLGAAELGGAWTVAGNAANTSVAPGAATLTLPAAKAQVGGYLPPARTDTDLRTRLALSAVPVGGSVYVTVQGRRVSSGTEYDARLLVNADRTVTLRAVRFVGGVETLLNGPVKLPVTYTPGLPLVVRVQVVGTGPTTVRARAWRASDTEPATWQVSATDTTAALQTAGTVGVVAYASSGVTNAPLAVTVGEVRARPTTAAVNQPPVPAVSASCRYLSCTLDGSASSDPDGRIARYDWDFGDGATGSGASVTHAYAVAGDWTVSLTTTDDRGATATTTRTVTTTSPPLNQPPTARFTVTCTGRSCSYDGSTSSDDEGITAYGWDFGDGATGSGPTVTHTYVQGGTYTVRLTVSDEYDTTAAATQNVTVSSSFVRDQFGRVVDNGWGSADVGGAWSVSGTASRYAVRPGYATMSVPAASGQAAAFLATAKRTDADLKLSLRLSAVPTGGPVYVTVSGRRVSAGNEYAARLLVNADRTVTLRLSRWVNNVETSIGNAVVLPGLVYSAGLVLNVRLQVSGTGTTAVRAKAWPVAGTEPAAWQVTASDTTAALQAAGYPGVTTYLSSKVANAPISLDLTAITAD